MDKNMLKDTAVSYVKEAADYIREQMKYTYGIDTKEDKDDLVTDVDRNVEKFFKDKISKNFSEHRLMGEEGSFENIKDLDGVVWILDPIDGTINFVHMGTNFAISVGIFEDGVPLIGVIYDVMNRELFVSVKGEGAYLNDQRLPLLKERPLDEALVSFNTGWVLKDKDLQSVVEQVRGTRSYGVAAIEIAYVAAGRLDAYISKKLAPWDIAGGCALLNEVGGVATNYRGEKLTFLDVDTLFAANPSIYKQIEKELKSR
ncbi:inositol monophosphatase family protein [Alkalicoccus halolimnae]|uniref:inositol-phosphate phosphatase n=1 Tax=Alkalicoccus halolimnae TaxID=1667239 RepID=A0A5C7FRY4_9BACI|nr:inositol monophosphatase family protein [Alkalicoccus halolimnae]TXF87465.1 inositol monophosphatase family protein [Alkalicoccus halolimnae]